MKVLLFNVVAFLLNAVIYHYTKSTLNLFCAGLSLGVSIMVAVVIYMTYKYED